MIIRSFTPEWKLWIWSNIVSGFNRESLFNILLNYGFDYNLIKQELEQEPTDTMVWQRQYSQQLLNEPFEVDILPLNKILCDNALSYRVETNLVEMYRVPDFLRYDECDRIVELMDPKCVKMRSKKDTPGRLTAEMGIDDPFLNVINERISEYLKISPDMGDPVEFEKYVKGAEYKEHYDYFPVGNKAKANQADLNNRGQREWSILIHLNNSEETSSRPFKHINTDINLAKGEALIWKNTYPSGKENPFTKHITLPTEGDKFTLKKYFRAGTAEIVSGDNVVEIPISKLISQDR